MAGAGGRLLPPCARRLLVARRSRAESLKRPAAGLLAGVAFVTAVAAAAGFYGARPGEMRDFEVYWTAAQRAASGEPLYRAADEHYQFKYLPAFAVLARPLGVLTLRAAKALWFTASTACLLALIWLSLRILPERRKPAWLLTAGIVVAMGKFYGHELVLGQVNLLFAVVATAGILALGAGRIAGATLLFVLCVVIKPYAVIFLPWLAWIGGRRVLLPVAAAGAAVLALPLVSYAPADTVALHAAWWHTVTVSTAPNLTNADNVSLAAFFAKWLGAGRAASFLAAGVSLALVVAAAAVVRSGWGVAHREVLEGSLLLMLIPLLSPQGWDYVFLVSTPAVALLVNYDDRLGGIRRAVTWTALLTIGLSLFDLLGRQRYAAFMNWSIVTLAFLVLVSALVTLRSRRAA